MIHPTECNQGMTLLSLGYPYSILVAVTKTSVNRSQSGIFLLIIPEYVFSLEKEIREVKARNRELTQSMINTNAEPENTVPVYDVDDSKNDVHIRSLVAQLNDTIGK